MLAALAKTLGGPAAKPPAEPAPAAAPEPSSPADADAEALLRETLGSAEVWPQLAAALRARSDAASASALAAWSRDEPQALLAELASLGLKMGHRQRLLLVLQHR